MGFSTAKANPLIVLLSDPIVVAALCPCLRFLFFFAANIYCYANVFYFCLFRVNFIIVTIFFVAIVLDFNCLFSRLRVGVHRAWRRSMVSRTKHNTESHP